MKLQLVEPLRELFKDEVQNRAMKWIWQQPDWPVFHYDNRALNDRELEFRLNSERLAGRFDALPMASQEDATIDLMLSEGIKNSAIEGEDQDRESVQSSLLSLMTSEYATGHFRPESSRGCFVAGGRTQELANISDA